MITGIDWLTISAMQIRGALVHYIGPDWLPALAFVLAGVVMMTAAYCTYGTISSVLGAAGALTIVSAFAFNVIVAALVAVSGGVVAAIITRRRRLQMRSS